MWNPSQVLSLWPGSTQCLLRAHLERSGAVRLITPASSNHCVHPVTSIGPAPASRGWITQGLDHRLLLEFSLLQGEPRSSVISTSFVDIILQIQCDLGYSQTLLQCKTNSVKKHSGRVNITKPKTLLLTSATNACL